MSNAAARYLTLIDAQLADWTAQTEAQAAEERRAIARQQRVLAEEPVLAQRVEQVATAALEQAATALRARGFAATVERSGPDQVAALRVVLSFMPQQAPETTIPATIEIALIDRLADRPDIAFAKTGFDGVRRVGGTLAATALTERWAEGSLVEILPTLLKTYPAARPRR